MADAHFGVNNPITLWVGEHIRNTVGGNKLFANTEKPKSTPDFSAPEYGASTVYGFFDSRMESLLNSS